jgi:hypothetical protein
MRLAAPRRQNVWYVDGMKRTVLACSLLFAACGGGTKSAPAPSELGTTNHDTRPSGAPMPMTDKSDPALAFRMQYQDPGGMWHQILDKPDSYLESSVTAMFVYAIAKAVNEGWINKRFITIAQNGWDALAKKVTADGQIPDICIGTSIEEDIRYYYTRPVALNDTHGLGAFLMAGAEIIKAKDKLVDMEKRR